MHDLSTALQCRESSTVDRPCAVCVEQLEVSYPSPQAGGDPVPALCGVDLQIESGAFVAVMGPLGSGKSTLCLALNGAVSHAVDCRYKGTVRVSDLDVRQVPMGQLALQVGLVFEHAEDQLFNATVADEIAFGLESMALPTDEIEQRIAGGLRQVGLVGFEERSPRTLSGGEQKRLALASVLAMRPRVLVLDEPTAGLDARARHEVLSAIEHLRGNASEQTTVIMSTQDAEAAAQFAERIVVLNKGQIVLDGSPTEVFAHVALLEAWGITPPQLARVAHRFCLPTTFTVHDAAQQWAGAIAPPAPRKAPAPPVPPTETVVAFRNVHYNYPGSAPVLRGISIDIHRGEWLAVIGINGSGKTTFLKHLNGLLRPTAGSVILCGKDTRGRQVGELARIVGYLPQSPDDSIFCATVREEVAYGPRHVGLHGEQLTVRVDESLAQMDLLPYANHPPAVLGYGLRRQVALASVLAMQTALLAFDEPTVGLDSGVIARTVDAVAARHQQGATVVMITHDLQLVARFAQRVVVLSEGRIRAQGTPEEVLADIALLRSVGLEPLPLTALGEAMAWPPPLPIDLSGWEGA